jgi:hypothetical protein
MTDEELRDAISILRQRANKQWHQHALWELIIDIETLLAGMPIERDRATIVKEVERALRILR